MQYTPVSLLSLLALGALANPLHQLESVPDDPVPAGGGPAIAANDVTEASLNNKDSWSFGTVSGSVYNPLSQSGNTCAVANMIGVQEVQKGALTDCYNNLNQGWGTSECGLLTWNIAKSGGHWKSSQDCYGANKDCIEAAIRAGFGDVTCYSQSNGNLGADSCKASYSYTVPLTPLDIMDPAKNPALH